MPKLQLRAILYGVALIAFGAIMLTVGIGIGISKEGLPPEQHPCLLLQGDDVGPIRERLTREPYSRWYARLQAIVREDATEESRLRAVAAAQRAKALAFAFLLTGERRLAERATEIMRRARPPQRGGAWGSLEELAAGAAAYAIAYDLLGGYLRSQTLLDSKCRLLLADLAHELSRRQQVWPLRGSDTTEIRRLCALGLCALAIRDYAGHGGDRAWDWYRTARQRVLDTLQRQVCADGAYAEGPGRHLAAARLYVPFLVASSHVTGEQLLSGRALAACEWGIRIRMPNGIRPNLDGSTLTPSYSFALTDLPGIAPHFAWDARTSDLDLAVTDDQLPEALTWYDDTAPAQPPAWPPTQFLEDSGDVVLRSNWGPDSPYLLLRAEHGQARIAGGSYAQPDATSIVLCLGDEILVLDTGYGGWARGKHALQPDSHSLVLVDGKGPPVSQVLGTILSAGVDAAVTDAAVDPDISAVRVRREQNQVTLERTVLFAAQRHFVIFDHNQARSGLHDFQWLLHVNAAGTTGGRLALAGNTARICRPGAALQVTLRSSVRGASTLRYRLASHFFQEGQEQTHALLYATASQQPGADFLAILSPSGPDEPPAVSRTSNGEGYITAHLPHGAQVVFRSGRAELIGDNTVCTDGWALYWLPGPAGPHHVLAMGARKLWVNGHLVHDTPRPTSFVWRPPLRPA